MSLSDTTCEWGEMAAFRQTKQEDQNPETEPCLPLPSSLWYKDCTRWNQKKTSISLAAGERPLLKDSSFGQTRHREVTGGVKVDVIRQC